MGGLLIVDMVIRFQDESSRRTQCRWRVRVRERAYKHVRVSVLEKSLPCTSALWQSSGGIHIRRGVAFSWYRRRMDLHYVSASWKRMQGRWTFPFE